MNVKQQRILGTIPAADLVGRERILDRIASLCEADSSALVILAAPGAGASEVLRQAYDRVFYDQQDVIPFHFSLSPVPEDTLEVAREYVHTFLTQTIAFRRRDPSILAASPELDELAELALPQDGRWIDRLIEVYRASETDSQFSVRSLLSAPLRAMAAGARVLPLIGRLEKTALMTGGQELFHELSDIYANADMSCVFAGARRFMYGTVTADACELDPLGFEDAGKLVETIGARHGTELTDQTRDLIAVQLEGRPAYITAFLASAAERGTSLDTFRAVEGVYADEIFGGRIHRMFGSLIEEVAGSGSRGTIAGLLSRTLNAGQTPLEFWQKNLKLTESECTQAMARLNVSEFVSIDASGVHIGDDRVFADYIRGRERLALSRMPRAQIVGEAVTNYLKRAPELLGRFYRRNAAVDLRSILGAFDNQEIAIAAIDYGRFRDEVKGVEGAEETLGQSGERVTLPQIVYTAHTAAFYSPLGELIDDERSAIALGFETSGYRDETVWIAAEVESKLEAPRELTEFWLDRLEMVAVNCGFENYRFWLVAPEGFDADAIRVLAERGAYGSSRRQVEMLARMLTGGTPIKSTAAPDEYEIVIPMGEDTEMIAAHTIEEIARRHQFPQKDINRIKTALVEACINATEHSSSPDRRIYVRFAVRGQLITITVANRGLRIADKQAREVTPDTGRRGWGLRLMQGLMDTVKIEQSDDGTRVTMTKTVTPAT